QRRDPSTLLLALLLRLRRIRAGCGRGRRSRRRRGLRRVRRGVSLGAGRDQARPELAQERGIGRELLREPRADPVPALRLAAREVLQALGAALDDEVGLGHCFAGGSSPVARRQTVEAVRRATTVAPAAIPP